MLHYQCAKHGLLIATSGNDQAHWETGVACPQKRNGTNDHIYLVDWGEGAGVNQAQLPISHPGSITCGCRGKALSLGHIQHDLNLVGTVWRDRNQSVAQPRCSDKDPIGQCNRSSLRK